MKIILCIFLLNITAVSVFGQSVELHGILGQSVKFTAAVKKDGFLIHGVTIGDVTSGKFGTARKDEYSNGNYRDRVQWDSSTGFFSLSGLKMEDIGGYKVHNTDQNIKTVFQLKVYKDNVPVSKPHVSITQNESCTIECTAERGTEVTLSWYREGEKKPYGSSPIRSAPDLYLPQTVHKGGIYTCEAKNSVSNETSDPLTVGAHCTAVSVFGILGDSVKFPAAVKKKGSLMHSSGTIGDVTKGSFTALPIEKFSGRVQWDSSTGLFSLSGLKMEDSGDYKVQNTDQNINTVFQLKVYIPVSKPSVTFISPCTLNCTVKRGTQGTLLWYRDSEKKSSYESSFSIAPHWHKFQAVLGSGTYTCEANNSVSNNKTSVYLKDDCRGGAAGIWQTEGSKMWSLSLVLIVMLCSHLV